MEFQKERVFTTLNADELKVGSEVIVADSIDELKQYVEHDCETSIITDIMPGYYSDRFNSDDRKYNLAYLISEPEWIVYLYRPKDAEPYLTSCRSDRWETVKEEYGAKTKLFESTEDECDKWYASRRRLTDVIAAWEDGKIIQYNSGYGWEDCCDNRPAWDVTSEYRIKPEEKKFKWADLKIGDIIKNKSNPYYYMVIGIDMREKSKTHIYNGVTWLDEDDLESWEKVEKQNETTD